ncbi:hypothetical protein QC762_511750 [Podospora pseudocomata]|uniref:Enoyl reductase (ER) domain-containing protein n=1 Tax=Podospora pseudocomata TaxID=2093779 RepID=A0ABR0GC08_9PEZI|nr:hypothetical protein QC762_511750 [Podospora pseudocomata]
MSDKVQNKTLLFKKVPTNAPIPGEHLAVEPVPFDLKPPKGGLTVAVLSASYDPYLRGKMRDPSIKSYSPPFLVGEPITNDTVSKVIRSDTPDFAEGDLIVAYLPLAEYAHLSADQLKNGTIRRRVDIKNSKIGKDLGLFLGPLGMPGLTAWSSYHEIGQPKKGETIFISSAAGAVGQVVGQVAKREGLRVIGSVGADEKLDFILNELGFDGGFNYKTENPFDALKRLAPDGVDIYFENVGGEQLEAAIEAMNQHGRIIACGMISQYSVPDEQKYGVKNLFKVVSKRITMRGFIVYDKGFADKYGEEHQRKMQEWLAEGSYKAKLSVTEGIDNAAEGLVGMLEGKNFGKAVLKIRDLEE